MLIQGHVKTIKINVEDVTKEHRQFIRQCCQLEDVTIILSHYSLSNTEIIDDLKYLVALRNLKVHGYYFSHNDIIHLSQCVQNIEVLEVYCSVLTLKPESLQHCINILANVKVLSLPICYGYDRELALILDTCRDCIKFGHQILDAVRAECLQKEKIAYLKH